MTRNNQFRISSIIAPTSGITYEYEDVDADEAEFDAFIAAIPSPLLRSFRQQIELTIAFSNLEKD